MADEIEDVGTDTSVEEGAAPKREDKRIKNLSEKVETIATERDTFKAEADSAKREAEFYKGFTGVVTKYPAAAEFQDQIREKVISKGYDLNDAAVALLVQAGKYNPAPKPVDNPAGGSATNQPPKAAKSVKEMSRDEMLTELLEREKRGEISLS